MASRFLARSKTLALALSRADAPLPALAGARALSSLPRYPACAAAPSPAVGSPPGLGKVRLPNTFWPFLVRRLLANRSGLLRCT